MVADHGKTCIQTLRVTAPAADPLALRLRLERALASRDLTPTGLPPSAIVCVRRLRSSHAAIGRLTADIEPATWGWASAWEQSVRDALGQLVSHAVRPLREAVPANAECVIFNDRAEMLACLAIDWRHGALETRWWWRGLLPQLNGARSVLAAWIESPEYVPAAWQYLAEAGKAMEFAGQINADVSREMVNGIVRRFALGELQTVFAVTARPEGSRTENKSGDDQWRSASGIGAGRFDQPRPGNSNLPIAPWQSWAAIGCDASLSPNQQLLVGIALTLQRAPAIARTRGFARAVQRWVEAGGEEPFDSGSNNVNSQAAPDSNRKTAITEPQQFRPEDVNKQPATALDKPRSDDDRAINLRHETRRLTDEVADLGSAGNDGPGACREDSDGRLPDASLSRGSAERADEAFIAGIIPNADASQESLSKICAVEPLVEAQINTNYGGLFYLLNVGLYLELYGDITTPSVRDIPLGAWDFLAMVGERLAGSELRSDPVWDLLAQLSGRDVTQEPGSDCVMPEFWRMPAQWMEPFEPEGVWRWAANEDRLRVWHPAGFIALDLPLEPGDPALQLRREMKAYAQLSNVGADLCVCPGATSNTESGADTQVCPYNNSDAVGEAQSSLQRWLDWLMPYARARLRRALGLAETDDVGRALCGYRARVFVTATHMDVMFPLAELMVEIRLAGLDRDPGWIPATGRIIRFHFE